VTSIVEQQTWHPQEDIRSTRRELEARSAAVDARSSRASGGSPGAKSTTVKPPNLDGATSWAVFHRQFEAAAGQNNWTSNERAAHLLSVLQGKAADIFRTVPAEVTNGDIVGVLRDRFGDHQLVAAYRSQFKARAQARRYKSSQHLAHRAFVRLPVAFIQRPPTLSSAVCGTGR
jgi:hypothetical protein